MTREEALEHLFVQDNIYVYHQDGTDLVNQIYDDFESHKCENCKHEAKCNYWDVANEIGDLGTFSCSDWEKQDD